VKVAKAEKRDVPVDLGAIGRAEALSSVSVRAQAAGTLQSVRFGQGERVRKGQVLFTIDSRPFEAALAEARAQVARDTALADNAEATVARYVELRARNADYVTQDAIDRLKAQAASQRQ
jgi:multidrug efflux system membrane fusion protein